MSGRVGDNYVTLALHPYPRKPSAILPDRQNFPVRPQRTVEPVHTSENAEVTPDALMNSVLARVQELGAALDDPGRVWSRLRAAWDKASHADQPQMDEIVRQAEKMAPILTNLEKRMRKVLRRTRELIALDRVQEMDRASMQWLSRQPGRTLAERAGSSQRIMAIARREDFDTPENRALRAYVELATQVARRWMIANERATSSPRFGRVKAFNLACERMIVSLRAAGVIKAEAGLIPNYVLLQDHSYSQMYTSWLRLLNREKILDDLWAWQAETWTDFCVLAAVLALDAMEEAELVAQSPVGWRTEPSQGRHFEQDRPLAVYWLRDAGKVVEVQARPSSPNARLMQARCHVALQVTQLDGDRLVRRTALWTPHAMQRINPQQAAQDAEKRLTEMARTNGDMMRDGLILTPAHGEPKVETVREGGVRVTCVALDAAGESLSFGLNAIAEFMRADLLAAEPT